MIPFSNPTYPMARLQGSAYAAPLGYNQPNEVVGGYDAKVNPMTGEEMPQTNFAAGGNVPRAAGLASLAQSHGRGGDSMLVHMAPQEVAGLQQLALAHGGSLTINPDTGLVEANFLKALLPTLIGAALTPLTGGAINPFTAGALVGGFETIRTGDLGKGLMAGLGAYGGAGLSSALAGAGAATGAEALASSQAAGTAAAQKAAEQGLNQAAQEAAKQAALKEAAQTAIKQNIASEVGLKGGIGTAFGNIGTGLGEIFKTGGAGLGGIGGMNAAGAVAKNLALPAKIGLTTSAASALTPDVNMPDLSDKIDDSYYQSGGYDPDTGTFRPGTWLKGYPGYPKPSYADGGGVAAPKEGEDLKQYYQSLLSPPATSVADMAIKDYMQGLNKFVTSPVEKPKTSADPGSTVTNKVNNTTGTNTSTGQSTVGLPDSTQIDSSDPRSFEYWYANRFKNPQPYGTTASSTITPGSKRWNPNTGRFEDSVPDTNTPDVNIDDPMSIYGYARGGTLEYAAGGKFLRGPGDGMSDDIKANINGEQEARLADGEFVIPADVVSHLGNGSSSAGAKKLYRMMTDIRKARTGRTRQAPAVKTDKYIPR